MSRDELLDALRELRGGDPEGGHAEADRLLLRFIGDDEITEAFEAIEKWYA
jgi:hypothetical protein